MTEKFAEYKIGNKPFGTFGSRIVGIQYYDAGPDADGRVFFERNPYNEFDDNAIEAQTPAGQAIGHLPRSDNCWLAELIDQGRIFLRGHTLSEGDQWHLPVCVEVMFTPKGKTILKELPPDSPGAVIHNHLLSLFREAGELDVEVLDGVMDLYKGIMKRESILPETRLLYALLPAFLEKRRVKRENNLRTLLADYLATADYGRALTDAGLTIVPLVRKSSERCPYQPGRQAIEKKELEIEEIDEHGRVSLLRARNSGNKPVFMAMGEGLRGAKQDRILNISMIIPVGEEIEIPVSCVERGRWRFDTEQRFRAGSCAGSDIRFRVCASVNENLSQGRGFSSNQDEVWASVDQVAEKVSAYSPSANLFDIYSDDKRPDLPDPGKFKYSAGAVGMAVFYGRQLVSVDIFAHPTMAEKLWENMINSAIAGFYPLKKGADELDSATIRRDIGRHLRVTCDCIGEPQANPGCGSYLQSNSIQHSAAILLDKNKPVHIGIFAKKTQ